MNQEQENGLFSQKINFNFKSVLIVVIVAIGIYLLVPRLVGLQEAARLMIHINKWFLLLALISEIIAYSGSAWLMGIILSRLGYKIRFWDRFRIGSIAAFAIHFFPVGSLGEGAVDYYFLRKKKVEGGSILIMLALRIIMAYTAFLIIFLLGLVLVPTVAHLPFYPKLISLVLFGMLLGGVSYMIYLYRNKDKFRLVWRKILRFADFFISKVRRRKVSQEKENKLFDDIYRGVGLFGSKKRATIMAIIAGMVYWLGDITCFYFVFLSFGFKIHWGILIFGYGVSSLAGMISFIPGGIGVTEASLGLMYSGLGVPSNLTLMSILVFRFFSFWIWIPFGLYSYLSLTRKKT